MYNRRFFPHRLRMSVSFSEAGAYVLPFSRFLITLGRHQPHEPSNRPLRTGRCAQALPGCRQGGGHGGAESERKGPPQVEKTAAKRVIPGILLF